MEAKKQRVCVVQKEENGFGFVLCCENNTTDTYVLHVLNGSPASRAGLKQGDKIIEVNGINVEQEEHKLVVQRLQGLQSIRLAVVHSTTAEEFFKEPGNGMTVKPLEEGSRSLRPKLITVARGKKGYDFTLQTMGRSSRGDELECHHRIPLKGISGHYAASVCDDGVAYKAGLREGHRIIQINGVQIEQESHAYVISTIKSSTHLELLVVDKETDEFFQSYGVSPTLKHLNGEVEFRALSSLQNSFDDSARSHTARRSKQLLQKVTNFPEIIVAVLLDWDLLIFSNREISRTVYLNHLYGYDLNIRRKNFVRVPRLHGDMLPKMSSLYHRRSIAPPSSHALSSRLYRCGHPSVAMSTPNLTTIGLLGRSRSSLSFTDGKSLEDSTIIQSAARAKRKIKKKLSKIERKPSKTRRYNVNLPKTRRLYDETEISTESEASSAANVEQLFSHLSIQNNRSNTRFGQSIFDLKDKKPPLASFKSFHACPKAPLFNYETTNCDMSIETESPEELSSIDYKVDLKTLKEHVRKKANRSKYDAIRSKSKLSDYALAHMYVNSY